jgi:hypothetical protein
LEIRNDDPDEDQAKTFAGRQILNRSQWVLNEAADCPQIPPGSARTLSSPTEKPFDFNGTFNFEAMLIKS